MTSGPCPSREAATTTRTRRTSRWLATTTWPPCRTTQKPRFSRSAARTGQPERWLSRAGKCRRYCGVELFPEPAAAARERLTEVVEGDVEQVELPWPAESFDALILSEVLEHLRDPWAVLERLRPLLRPGALVFASTPNVAHREIIVMLLKGRWELQSYGPLDATHLRWFSPSSLRRAFEEAGFVVDSVGTARSARARQRDRRSRAPWTSTSPLASADRPARSRAAGAGIAASWGRDRRHR